MVRTAVMCDSIFIRERLTLWKQIEDRCHSLFEQVLRNLCTQLSLMFMYCSCTVLASVVPDRYGFDPPGLAMVHSQQVCLGMVQHSTCTYPGVEYPDGFLYSLTWGYHRESHYSLVAYKYVIASERN